MRWWVVLGLVVACAKGEARKPTPTVLRVSTSQGLQPLTPTIRGTFARNISDFVYPSLTTWFSSIEVQGNRLILTPRQDNTTPLESLVAAAKHPALRRISFDDGKLVAEFADAESARDTSVLLELFDVGPYRVESSTTEELVLARRSGDGPDIIDVTAVTTQDEEWRRLLAGQIDLIPVLTRPGQLRIGDVPSVRILPDENQYVVALHFCMLSGCVTSNADLRRAIALGLRRGPIAESLTGDATLARPETEDVAEARRLLAAAGYGPTKRLRLRAIVPGSMNDLTKVSAIVDEQLSTLGADFDMVPIDNSGLQSAIVEHEFDVLLFYGDFAKGYFRYFVGGGLGNISGYRSEEFDQATDDETKIRVLRRDLPMTPLYSLGEGIAIDRRFCGAHPTGMADYRWITAVHLCKPGETE